MKSYKDLDIYVQAFELSVELHTLTLKLPNYELYEQGNQIRRSSKSIKDNIVEGYGRRKYKSDFLRYLTVSHASLLECQSQLETVYEIHKMEEFRDYIRAYDRLGAKIYSFRRYVEDNWKE